MPTVLSAVLWVSTGAYLCGCSSAPTRETRTTPRSMDNSTPMHTDKENALTNHADASKTSTDAKSLHWADMNFDQRLKYMGKTVMPEMRALFSSFEKENFEDMNCATCHGAGAENDTFEMPNPLLPKLSVGQGFAKELKEHPNGTRFMMEQVVPSMAKLLDTTPYSAETKQGFGCFNCHTPISQQR